MESVQSHAFAGGEDSRSGRLAIQDLLLRGVRRSVLNMLERYGARTVLDACSGAGTLSHMIEQRGMSVQAVDASRRMADYSRKRYGILTKVAPIESLGYHEQFDAAVIGMTLHELGEEQRLEVWRRLEQAVKNTGIVIAVDFTTPPPGLLNQALGRLLRRDELGLECDHPGSHEEARRFMEQGGLLGWLHGRGEYIQALSSHALGNIVVAVMMR